MTENFFIYLLVIAGVTYLVRMLPMVLVKKKITNTFIRSFLYYVPYAVLGVMTVPAIFYSTSYLASAIVGFTVACVLAYFGNRELHRGETGEVNAEGLPVYDAELAQMKAAVARANKGSKNGDGDGRARKAAEATGA